MNRLALVERLRELTVEAKRLGLNSDVVVDEYLHAAATGMTAAHGYDYAIEKIENVLESLRNLRNGEAQEYGPDDIVIARRSASRRGN